jgi:hypothetical protein
MFLHAFIDADWQGNAVESLLLGTLSVIATLFIMFGIALGSRL